MSRLSINNEWKKPKPRPLNYRIGFLAGCFAAHTGRFQSLTLDKKDIVLSGKKSPANKVAFLAVGSGIIIEQGYFWDTLVMHLEDRNIIRFGGIANRGLTAVFRIMLVDAGYVK